jgi:hypothetical protein
MEGTNFEVIYDRFLLIINDYHLNNLAKTNYSAFLKFLKGLLVNSIDLFNGVLTDLSYEEVDVPQVVTTDSGEEQVIHVKETRFINQLSSKEISILAMICAYRWMENKVLDVTQFELHLDSKSFSVKSEQANLKQKEAILNDMREKYMHEILEYQNSNIEKLPFFGE